MLLVLVRFLCKLKFKFEIPALGCSCAQHVQMWMLWPWGVTLNAPVVMAAPGFVQERELTFVPSHLRHILRAVDVFGSFHGLSTFWHMTVGCMSQFQDPSWDPFDENMDAPSSKHSCSELNMSPQAPSMSCREGKALLGCALYHPPVGVFKIGQRVALLKMLISLVVSLVSSVSHVLCCILEQLRGVSPAPLPVGMQAGSIANKSSSKSTVVVWLSPFLFILARFCWDGGRGNKQAKKAIWEVDFQGN